MYIYIIRHLPIEFGADEDSGDERVGLVGHLKRERKHMHAGAGARARDITRVDATWNGDGLTRRCASSAGAFVRIWTY